MLPPITPCHASQSTKGNMQILVIVCTSMEWQGTGLALSQVNKNVGNINNTDNRSIQKESNSKDFFKNSSLSIGRYKCKISTHITHNLQYAITSKFSHIKKQENVPHSQEKKQSIETDSKITQMMKLSEKDFKPDG